MAISINAPKIVSGSRAIVSWMTPTAAGGVEKKTAGMFTSVSYHILYGTQAVFVLGRFQAPEIEYTHMEPVTVQMSGWRAWKHGPYADGNIPKLKDLLDTGYCELLIYDRVGTYTDGVGEPLARISKLRPTGYFTTLTSRQLSELAVSAVGLLAEDETTYNKDAESVPCSEIFTYA